LIENQRRKKDRQIVGSGTGADGEKSKETVSRGRPAEGVKKTEKETRVPTGPVGSE